MKLISSYLNNRDSKSQQNLYSRVKLIGNLDAKLKQHLPDEIIEKFQLSNIDSGTATLHAVSAAWATRLRYLTPKILSLLKSELDQNHVSNLRIRVYLPDIKMENKRSISISQNTANLLKQHAINIQNEKIKACYLSLSKKQTE